VAIRVAGGMVQATLVKGEAMDIRIAGATRNLTDGATLQAPYELASGSRLPHC